MHLADKWPRHFVNGRILIIKVDFVLKVKKATRVLSADCMGWSIERRNFPRHKVLGFKKLYIKLIIEDIVFVCLSPFKENCPIKLTNEPINRLDDRRFSGRRKRDDSNGQIECTYTHRPLADR